MWLFQLLYYLTWVLFNCIKKKQKKKTKKKKKKKKNKNNNNNKKKKKKKEIKIKPRKKNKKTNKQKNKNKNKQKTNKLLSKTEFAFSRECFLNMDKMSIVLSLSKNLTKYIILMSKTLWSHCLLLPIQK